MFNFEYFINQCNCMKTFSCLILSLSLTFCLLFSKPIWAQQHIVKLNLFGVVSNSYGGSYEFVPSDRFGIAIEGNYLSQKRDDGFNLEITSENGYNIAPQVRFYPGNAYEGAPKGLFFGVNFIYENLNVERNNIELDSLITSGTVTNLGYGVIVGSQWIFQDRFAIDLLYNPYYNSPTVEGNLAEQPSAVDYTDKKGLQFNRFLLSFGIAF